MKREKRYTVLKDKDIEKWLDPNQRAQLDDWPEYETVWGLIAARVDRTVEETTRNLQAPVKEEKKLPPGLYDDLPPDSYF